MGKLFLYVLFTIGIIVLVSLAALSIVMALTAYLAQWIGPAGTLLLYLTVAALILYCYNRR